MPTPASASSAQQQDPLQQISTDDALLYDVAELATRLAPEFYLPCFKRNNASAISQTYYK